MANWQKLFLKFMKQIIVVLLVCYIISIGLLAYFQRSFIYLPSADINHGLKEIAVDVENAKLKIIVLNEGHENAILYFGGNAEGVYANSDNFLEHFKDYTIYLVNYRGYGGSSGEPSEESIYDDALLIYDKLTSKHKNISIIGRSLGSGVATYVSSKRNVRKLILITPFDSIENIAKEKFPFYPIELILSDKYDSIDRAKYIKAKTLILMAKNDTLIPNKNSIKLYNAFALLKAQKQIFNGVGHNDIQMADGYFFAIEKFLKID